MKSAAAINETIDLLSLLADLRKVASTNGGEWAGPCPFCGGRDRFRVQPNRPKGQRWFCRQCANDRWHSPIDFIMRRDGKSFKQVIGISENFGTSPIRESEPVKETDRKAWLDSAYDLLAEAQDCLWGQEGTGAREYLHSRGLNDDTLQVLGIGFIPDARWDNPKKWGLGRRKKVWIPSGILIPCEAAGLRYLKVRQLSGDPKYYILPGGQTYPFLLWTFKGQRLAFLFESEFCAALAWQSGFVAGYASLPAGQKIKVEYQPFFESAVKVVICFDSDPAGQKAAQEMGKYPGFVIADPFPKGKDLTEFFQLSDKDRIAEWLISQGERV